MKQSKLSEFVQPLPDSHKYLLDGRRWYGVSSRYLVEIAESKKHPGYWDVTHHDCAGQTTTIAKRPVRGSAIMTRLMPRGLSLADFVWTRSLPRLPSRAGKGSRRAGAST